MVQSNEKVDIEPGEVCVCPECFDEPTLRKRLVAIRPSYKHRPCDYHPTKKGIPLSAVAAIFDPVIRDQYYPGQIDYDGEQRGDDLSSVVSELGQIDNWNTAAALATQLADDESYWPTDGDEPFYGSSGYQRNTYDFGDSYLNTWDLFRESILHENRFFNDQAESRLTQLFDGIEHQTDKAGHPAVYALHASDPAVPIYRGRIVADRALKRDAHKEPWLHLAPPPKGARSPGRMNPSGIAVFYGAMDQNTCLAELRAPVGAEVMVGSFKLLRTIYVLDLTTFAAPPKPISPFDETYLRRVSQWRFLERFQREISQTISHGTAHLDYVTTQVFAEFLTNKLRVHIDGEERSLDGIIFQSAQRPPNKNIALFNDAGRVALPETNEKLRRSRPLLGGIPWLPYEDVPAGLGIEASDVTCCRVTGIEYSSTPVPLWDEDEWQDKYGTEDPGVEY